jgi:acetyl/propionyl-CoA carboxylase alpha subunit
MNKPDSLVVEMEGERFTLTRAEWENLDCIEINEDTYHFLDDHTSHSITVLDFDLATRRCTLKVDGEIKKVTFLRDLDLLIEKMGLNSTQSKRLSVLHAPMPGLVTGIKITTGQEVEKGSPLLILEAMKMENVITAPHDAIIRQINVNVGQAIDKGAVLVEFEVD